MDYNKIIIALVIILIAIAVAGVIMLNQTENKATNNTNINNNSDVVVVDTISQESSDESNQATSEPKQYYDEHGHLIVFDSDTSCHVVDSNGNTIPGSGSNYYIDGDKVVMTGQR